VYDDKLGPQQQMTKNAVEWKNKIVEIGVELEY
jgi:hypothetical protein